MNIFMRITPETLIRIGLAILLLICLLHLPYGYYQLIRYVAVVGFAFLAWYALERKNTVSVILYLALALLFQPLVKVPMHRSGWVVIDIAVAAGLIVSVFLSLRKRG